MIGKFEPLATPVCGALAALVLLAAPARADDRLVTRAYDSNEVVRVTGKLGVQATIGFGEKESIENVAVGDAESWQITPNKRADLLFVKPLAANARTNMTVVTDKHTYFFDLVASPQARPVYLLRFTYKDEAKPAQPPQPGSGESLAALTDAERRAVEGDLAGAPVDPAALNFAWRRNGPATLLPERVYDDGQSTYLFWGARQAVPAILVTNERGEEGPVNYAVRGGAIVIDDVPARILLRSGRKIATLEKLSAPAAAAAAASPVSSRPLAQAQTQ